jgi:hypothetical protein
VGLALAGTCALLFAAWRMVRARRVEVEGEPDTER